MNAKSLIVSISTESDLNKIDSDTEYLNVSISNPSHAVISYLKKRGSKYKYTDLINNKYGYNYADYDTFIKAEKIIDIIIASMPNDLSDLEIAKYLYVSLGSYLAYDINADYEKTEIYNLSLINKENNLWGALASHAVNDLTASKIYYYLCRRLNLDAEIIIEEDSKNSLVKLTVDAQVIVTDLHKDIPYILAKMQTRHFGTYNDDTTIDKRIKYLGKAYTDYYLDKALKNIDYTNEDCVKLILNKTKDILNVDSFEPGCLTVIYKYLFNSYAPNYDIKINNLYLNTSAKKHFLLISYNNIHYSYNYRKREFVSVTDNDIIDSINDGKIGLYFGELIPNINNY